MGPCHSSKNSNKPKNQYKDNQRNPVEKSNLPLPQADQSLSMHNSQFQRLTDEKLIIEKLDYFLSNEIGFKLRSGVPLKTLMSSKNTGIITDFMMIELSKFIYKKIKDQEGALKDYHRYIQSIKQFIDVAKIVLDSTFEKLETDKPITFFNKNCPCIVFTNLLIVFHAVIFHKSVLWVKPEDRWWTKNKTEDNLQSLLSLLIEIAGKIKYEYDPKIINKKQRNSMINSKVYSMNSHEEAMVKSSLSSDSKYDKNKKESDFFHAVVSPHFPEKILKEEEKNFIIIKKSKSSEDIAAKYKTVDEILENSCDDEVNEEAKLNNHKARDCEKYMFSVSPKMKKK